MNWVGGARQRVKVKNERRIQREFFERRRKAKKHEEIKPKSDGKSIDKNAVSQDLLFLYPLNSREISGFPATSKRPVNFVDLSKPKKTRIQHNVNIDDGDTFHGLKSRLEFGRVDDGNRSFQRIHSAAAIQEKGETPLPRDILDRHIAEAENRRRRNDKTALEERTTSKLTQFGSPGKNEKFSRPENKLSILPSLESNIGKENLPNAKETPCNKDKLKTVTYSKKRFFPQKPATEKAISDSYRNEKTEGILDLRNLFQDSVTSHSTPISRPTNQLSNDFSNNNDDGMNITRNIALQVNKTFLLDSASREHKIQLPHPTVSSSEGQRISNKLQKDANTSASRSNENISLPYFNAMPQLQADQNTTLTHAPSSQHQRENDDYEDNQLPKSANHHLQSTNQMKRTFQNIVNMQLPNAEANSPTAAHFLGNSRQGIDKEQFDIANIASFRNLPRNDSTTDLFPIHKNFWNRSKDFLSSPVFSHRHIISKEDFEPLMPVSRTPALNTDQLCPRGLETTAGVMHDLEDDSEEDRFRQEMFKQKSAFNLSFHSDIDKEVNSRSTVCINESTSENKFLSLRDCEDLEDHDKIYHLPVSNESDMLQSVPEALVEVLEMDGGCDDEEMSPEHSRLKSEGDCEFDFHASSEESILPKEEMLRYNFEKKATYTREEEDNNFANKSKTFDEELEEEACFEGECLLPCNKATQTIKSEEDFKKDIDFFDKEDYSTLMKPLSQTKNSTAVQTDALFCSKCECLVCDLVNDIDAKDKQSDFGEKPLCRRPSDPIDQRQTTSDWTDSLEHEKESSVEMRASNGECVDASKVLHENTQNEIEKNLVQASLGATSENGDNQDVALDIRHGTSNLEVMRYGRSNPLATREEIGNSLKSFLLSPCVIQTRSRTANLRKENRIPSGN
eukprot:gene2024-17585_t